MYYVILKANVNPRQLCTVDYSSLPNVKFMSDGNPSDFLRLLYYSLSDEVLLRRVVRSMEGTVLFGCTRNLQPSSLRCLQQLNDFAPLKVEPHQWQFQPGVYLLPSVSVY